MLGSLSLKLPNYGQDILPLVGFGVPKAQDRAFASYRDLSSPTWSLQHEAGATICVHIVYLFCWINVSPFRNLVHHFYEHIIVKPVVLSG